MNFNVLSPVHHSVIADNELTPNTTLGDTLKIHTTESGIPDLDHIKIAILGVLENRNDINYNGEALQLTSIRKALYSLFPGNWSFLIADLGNIEKGETVEDTYYALKTVVEILLKKNIIAVILGGSQDLTYANYRAYDNIHSMINIANVDNRFDLGDSSRPIKNNSFIGKVILDKPYNLFNYATIGYQTYLNPQDNIELMESLFFEAYRLGEVINGVSFVEPVLRDAHIVSIDLKSIKASELDEHQGCSTNGFTGREICAITRYAGISNKVSSFGIYDFKSVKASKQTTDLTAQMIWYFIEGVSCRVKDDDFSISDNYQKFTVLVTEQELVFYKSKKTSRWWIEIPFLKHINNKLKQLTLLPCTYKDYEEATNGNIPQRWHKAFMKNGI